MLNLAFRAARSTMKKVYIYQGYGMYEKDSVMLHREFTFHLKGMLYIINYITPEQIKAGDLQKDVALLAIGGGFDLGLIKALGQDGMTQIREYVESGGRYLGICSGAYFASEYIEFDKGGPLEVVGERFLKFYPGVSSGPLYKKYIYNSTEGAVNSLIYFDDSLDCSTGIKNKFHCSSGHQSSVSNGFKNGYINGCITVDHKEVGNNKRFKTFHINKSMSSEDDSNRFQYEEVKKSNIIGTDLGTKNGLWDHETKTKVIEEFIKSKASNDSPTSSISRSANFSKPFKVFFNGGGYFTEKTMHEHLKELRDSVSLDLESKDKSKVLNGMRNKEHVRRSHLAKSNTTNISSTANNIDSLADNVESAENNVYAKADNVDSITNNVDSTENNIDVKAINVASKANNVDSTENNVDSKSNKVDSTMSQCELGHCRTNLISNQDQDYANSIEAGSVFNNVTVLSRYLDLPNQPIAVVKCKVNKGLAVLSFAHFEYDSVDVKDESKAEMKEELDNSQPKRKAMFRTILKHLGIEFTDR